MREGGRRSLALEPPESTCSIIGGDCTSTFKWNSAPPVQMQRVKGADDALTALIGSVALRAAGGRKGGTRRSFGHPDDRAVLRQIYGDVRPSVVISNRSYNQLAGSQPCSAEQSSRYRQITITTTTKTKTKRNLK